jgi:hypothetical protein
MVKRTKPAGWHGGSRQSLRRTGQEPETAEHKTRRDNRQPGRRPRLQIEVRYTRDARIPLPPGFDPVWQIFDTSKDHKTGWPRVIIRFDGDDAE